MKSSFDRRIALKQLANDHKIYNKCTEIAFWLITGYQRKNQGEYNIFNRLIDSRRILIESDNQKLTLEMYINSNLVLSYHMGKLIKFQATSDLIKLIDTLFTEAMIEKEKNLLDSKFQYIQIS